MLRRPDGVEIHCEVRGEGPVVALIVHSYAQPEVLKDLLSDLASDHTVVTHDGRGSGRSTRQGPYDLETEADEAASRPDLIGVVVAIGGGGGLVSATEAEGTERLAGSKAVRGAITEMMARTTVAPRAT